MAYAGYASSRLPVEEVELDLLLEGIYRRYGIDFRNYSRASLARRVMRCMKSEKLRTVSALQERVLHDSQALARFVACVSVHSTAMFRDPEFYRAFRERLVPELSRLPSLRLWHAGCSTGEEVYSIAILLLEEGLLDRTRIYATDMNESGLMQAREGAYPLRKMEQYAANYRQAGGKRALTFYFEPRGDVALFDPALQRDTVWATHNLVTDASFNEFQVVLCRNVMIYFNPSLQRRVHSLLYDSLAHGGYLALGRQESIELTGYEPHYAVVDPIAKIYRKL
jgi:chemotaxis protein methyltransferase CheR